MAPPWPMMTFGKMEAGGQLTDSEQKQADSTFDDYKKLQELMDVTDGFTTLPNASMRESFDVSIRHSQHYINDVFFKTKSGNCVFGNVDYTEERNELATYLITKCIARVTLCNYNQSVNGPQARNKWFDIIHGEKGTAMGRSLLKQDLIDHHDFQFFLDDKEKWLPMVESLLQDEVYITGTIVKQLTAQANLPGKMKFFVLQALGSKKIDQIADKWIACSNKNIVQPALDFIRKDNHLEFISAWLDDDPYYNEVNDACSEHWAQPCGNYIDHYYGVHVHDWLADYWNGPERYGLTVNVNVINYHYSEYVGGCFLAGTMVLAEEHKEMPIEDLQENDLILGRSGDIAVISNENAGVTLKVDTPAFGFNDDEPFFLSSHPFWSQDGWRALNPQTAKDENDWLEIGQLRQGDYVCKVKSINGNDIEYEWVKIKRVNIKVYPAGTRFHGIHTREGPRSYHANRYLVMQNYPEITIQRVADRLSKVDKKTQNRIRQQLKRLTPTFKHALGNAPAEAIASLAEKRVLYELTKSSKGKKSAVHSKDFTLPLFELKYDKEVLSHGSYTMPSSLKIHRRQLFVDKQFVEEKFISEDKEITWCRKVNGSLWEHGCIKLHGIGFYGKGFIALTKSKNDTDVLLHAEVKAHFKVNIFNCYKSKEEVEVIEEDKKEIIPKDTLTWEPCGSFEMGLKFDPEVSTWSAVDIGNLGGRDNLGGDIKLNTNDQDALVIDATIRPKYAKYAEHIILYAEFDGLYRTFQGYCTEYDVEAPDFKGKSYGWKGIFDKYDEYDADDDDDLEKARQELLKSKMHSKANIGLTTQHIKKELQLGQVQVHSNMVAILRSQVKTSLSLDDLFTLTGPDQKELHSRTFALLEKCMRFEMADEDREAVLGDAKPDLNSDERAVADAHKDFIGTRFAHCYLMNALGNQEAFDDRISETRKNQLLYFFGGDDDEGCLARDIDYNSANNEFARLAFIQLCPRVKDYMNDDGPGWADKLYDYITTPEKLLDFAMMTQITQDTEKVQKQSMVLYCLDPDRDLAKDFYNKVMMTKLQYNFDFFNGNEEDVDDMIDICGDILQLLINKILADDDKEVTGEIAQQCQQELKELQDELVAHGKDLMTASIDFVTAVIRRAGFEGDFWDRYFAAGKAVLDEMSPKIAGKALKWLAGMVLPAFAFIYTLKAFIAFDVLPPEQKASVIMDASYAALSVINKGGPKLVNKIKECFNKGKGDFKFVTMLDDAERTGVTLKRITTMVETAGEVVAGETVSLEQAIAKTIAGTEGDLVIIESRWTRAFKMVGKVAKVTGVVASFVGAIATGIQLYRDIKNGAPPSVIALETIETVAFAMVAVCEALTLAIESQVIPIVGQVCAVVGLVASIILLFLHKTPEETRTPAEIYCDERGGPYVDKLTIPSDEWLENWHNQHDEDDEDDDDKQ